MESYKDVIVSQPPAMYANAGYTTNLSLENYKGILLCDRPTHVATSSYTGSSGAGLGGELGKSFLPAGRTGNPIGMAPSTESQEKREILRKVQMQTAKQRRQQSNQVLSRHKRWLHTFAQQMKRMQDSEREQTVAAARRAAALRAAESQRRAQPATSAPVSPDAAQAEASKGGGYRATAALTPPPLPSSRTALPAIASNQEQRPRAAVSAPTSATAVRVIAPSKPSNAAAAVGKSNKRKPKWAMTEDEALEEELALADDLVAFAEHLDYEKFVNDCEVAEALLVMRDRVKAIAKANHWTDEDILRAASDRNDDDNGGDGVDEEEEDDESRSEGRTSSRRERTGTPTQQRLLRLQRSSAGEARVALPGAVAGHDKDWDGSIGKSSVLKRAISRDAVALAERLLASSPSLQKVHTKQSLARLLQRCVLSGDVNVTAESLSQQEAHQTATANGGEGGGKRSSPSPAVEYDQLTGEALAAATAIGPAVGGAAPVVVQVSADATTTSVAVPQEPPRILRQLQQSKTRTQGLPYLYRCPAI